MEKISLSPNLKIDRTVRSTAIDIAQPVPHIKIEPNGSVKKIRCTNVEGPKGSMVEGGRLARGHGTDD